MLTTHLFDLDTLQPATFDAGQVFDGKPSGQPVQGYVAPSVCTPRVDSEYLFHEAGRDIIVWFMVGSDPLYVFGPTGSGKSTCIKQLAARLNYPVFEVTGHGRLEFADLVGHLAVKDGNMVYEYGPLALAMRYGGLILVNEIDLTPPEVAAGFNTILDGAPLCIAENGGELITPHPLFRFAATANTNGGGDETGLYQGTQRHNLAWLDRFMLCEMGYPAPAVEKALLARRFPVLPEELGHKLVHFATEVRKLFMGEDHNGHCPGGIEVTLSTRTLLRWAELTLCYQHVAPLGIQPVTHALDRALAYRASRETRAMLHELAQRIFSGRELFTRHSPASDQDDAGYLQQALQKLVGCETLAHYARLPDIRLHQHSNNISGGNFWRCTVMATGISINWGRWNTVGQTLQLTLSQCAKCDPVQELLVRARKKIDDGYTLDRHTSFIDAEWQDELCSVC